MMDLKKTVLKTTAITAGGVLYVGLNWIPIIGPLAVGFLVGYTVKESPKAGFKAGVYSAALGAILTALILGSSQVLAIGDSTLLAVLIAWILLLWNMAGILLAGLGGFMGSLFGQARTMLGMITPALGMMPLNITMGMPKTTTKRVLKLKAPPVELEEGKKIKFRICEKCGSSNPESSKVCETCRKKL